MKANFARRIHTLRRHLPEGPVALLFLLTIANLVLALAFLHRETHPPVVVYDPSRGAAELVRADRDRNLRALLRGGFLAACQVATGSWPYDLREGSSVQGGFDAAKAAARQLFAPEVQDAVRRNREQLAVMLSHAAPQLSYSGPPEEAVTIRDLAEGFYFEAFLTQSLPEPDGKTRLRGFHVRAKGLLAPVTEDNPWNLRLNAFHLREVSLVQTSN